MALPAAPNGTTGGGYPTRASADREPPTPVLPPPAGDVEVEVRKGSGGMAGPHEFAAAAAACFSSCFSSCCCCWRLERVRLLAEELLLPSRGPVEEGICVCVCEKGRDNEKDMSEVR